MTESDNDTDTSSSRSQARQSAAALTKDAKRRMASRRLRKSLQASLLQIFPFCENDDSFMADTLRDTYGYRGYVSEVDVRDRHDQLWRHPPSKSAEWWTDLRSGRSKFDDREAVENAFWADNNSLPGVDIDAPWSETVADRHAHVESRDVCSNDRYSRAIKQLTADLSDERSDSAIEHDPDGLLYLTFINLKNDCIPPSMRVPETRARVTARLARWNLAGSKTGLRSRHKSGASLSLGEETVKDLDSIWSTLCGIENRRRVKNREQWDDDRRLQSRTDRHIRAIDLIQPCSSGLS